MLKRHDLVFFNRNSIDRIISNARCIIPDAPQQYWDELFEWVGIRIPGIVCRQESGRKGYIDVGFSSHRRVNGVHYRVSASVPLGDIDDIMTPDKAMRVASISKKVPNKVVIHELYSLAHHFGISVGLFGSYSMQVVTGLPYVSASSDYDLLINGEMDDIRSFYYAMEPLLRINKIKTDVEVRIKNCGREYDVKLDEIMSSCSLFMGKSISGVALLSRDHEKVALQVI